MDNLYLVFSPLLGQISPLILIVSLASEGAAMVPEAPVGYLL